MPDKRAVTRGFNTFRRRCGRDGLRFSNAPVTRGTDNHKASTYVTEYVRSPSSGVRKISVVFTCADARLPRSNRRPSSDLRGIGCEQLCRGKRHPDFREHFSRW